ncbi:MAG: dTDP-4-dehydrorhamnose reductase [Armatimonadaceae bacterium]
MRVLVTGAGGMLGTDVCAELNRQGKKVIPTGRKAGLLPLDITDLSQCRAVLETNRPDVAIHCAAWTDVDGAERDPAGAYRGNALGAWNMADAAARTGCWLIYVSTDFVFDGEKGTPYTEFDRTNPLGAYGASKEAGEQLVRQLLPGRHMIARTSWLFGKHGKCFPKTILRLAETRPELPVVADQIGCPTYTGDLARKLVELASDPLAGTYHICNEGACSWKEFAEAIVAEAGLSTTILPITAAEYATRFNSPTRRPAYSVMERLALSMRGKEDLRPWREALKDFLSE